MTKSTKTKAHLAIIDDDRILQRILTTKLTRLGYTVTAYDGAVEAVEGLKEKKVDLIILDLIMPEMDGFEFLKYWGLHGNAPVIVLSNLSDPADIKRCTDMGARAFFVKANYSFEEILESIASYV
jgi:CheY-like chemotaxis protein